MSHTPRQWIPEQVMHGVIRTIDRFFLLIPNSQITNIIGSSVGRALEQHPVQLHACMAHTNHIHFLLSVTHETLGNGTRFFQYLNGLIAKEINKHWNRTGHLWGERISLEPVVDDAAAEKMLAYVMTNPVKDDLVDHVYDWRGFSTYKQLEKGKPVSYNYIARREWWQKGGPRSSQGEKDFQKTTEVQTTPLPHWQNWSEVHQRKHFTNLIKTAEAQNRERRSIEGKKAMGMPAVMRNNHRDRPTSKPKKGPKPLCHASSKGTLRAFKDHWKEFINAYRQASAYYRSGILDIEFPPGSFRPPLVLVCVTGS